MLPSVDKLMNYEALKVDPAILSPAELMFNKKTLEHVAGLFIPCPLYSNNFDDIYIYIPQSQFFSF